MSLESPLKFNRKIIPSKTISLWKSLERGVDAIELYCSCASKVLIHPPSTCADLIAFRLIAFHNQIDSLVCFKMHHSKQIQ